MEDGIDADAEGIQGQNAGDDAANCIIAKLEKDSLSKSKHINISSANRGSKRRSKEESDEEYSIQEDEDDYEGEDEKGAGRGERDNAKKMTRLSAKKGKRMHPEGNESSKQDPSQEQDEGARHEKESVPSQHAM